jgi:hypothetical protein
MGCHRAAGKFRDASWNNYTKIVFIGSGIALPFLDCSMGMA